jgi:two-component system sensor histidine kinase PilS (NtrC family)
VAEFQGAYPEPVVRLKGTPGEPEVLVVFDRSQLHQVLWKLLENAVRHSGKPPAETEVELRCHVDEPTQGYCLLSVRDNGKGIPPSRMGEIFDAFYTTHNEGSGLGLYIARQLCEANQSELTVDSAPGRYTRFKIRMARATGAPAAAATY